jgi:CheY-like chemotaxis protein
VAAFLGSDCTAPGQASGNCIAKGHIVNLDGQQPHILCINHSPEILELLRTLLEDEGYRVSTLMTLDRSLDAVIELHPDVITIDYMWETSDNEWTYLNLLTVNPRTREIPIILCTGAVKRAIEMQSHLETIGVKVVLKPFDLEQLLSAVRESLSPERTSDPKLITSDE